jgi:hypothetical protein
MARYAIIVGGAVLNVVESDQENAEAYAAREGGIAVESATAGPGDEYDGGQFARPAPPVPPLPDEVETYKAHVVLILWGKMAAVKAYFLTIEDDTARELAEAMFYRRPTIRRIGELTQQVQYGAGITDAERDAMFVQAAAL